MKLPTKTCLATRYVVIIVCQSKAKLNMKHTNTDYVYINKCTHAPPTPKKVEIDGKYVMRAKKI